MRSLIILVLIGVAVCDDTLIRKRRGTTGYGQSYGSVRVDAQEMRIGQLQDSLNDLESKVGNGYDEVPDAMQTLEKRLGSMEGNDCPSERPFSCGRHSGQCVQSMLVCDGHKDCDNDADEDEAYCENPCPAGRSWTGTAVWDSCLVRSNNQFSLLITGNKRYEHYRTRLWVDAVIIESYSVAGEAKEETWSCNGYYNYSNRMLTLYPPAGSSARIGMKCNDSGPKTTTCTFISEASKSVCGTATLTRGA